MPTPVVRKAKDGTPYMDVLSAEEERLLVKRTPNLLWLRRSTKQEETSVRTVSGESGGSDQSSSGLRGT